MNCPSCGYENIDGIDRCENCLAPFRQLDIPSRDAAEGIARSVMEDNLSRLHADETVRVAPDTPAIDAIRLMNDADAPCALVIEGQSLAGIFTEHDVLLHMTSPSDYVTSNNMPVREFMSPHPETLEEGASVAEALNKMSMGRYRNMPFRRSDGSYAVASIKSVLKYIAAEDW